MKEEKTLESGGDYFFCAEKKRKKKVEAERLLADMFFVVDE